jgi:bacterial/archaeal transporter family-2 protein
MLRQTPRKTKMNPDKTPGDSGKMSTTLLVVIVGLLGGIAVGLQGPLASMVTQKLGTLESIFIIHIGGAIAGLTLLILLKGGGNLASWRSVPWYALVAGVLGLAMIGAIGFMIPRVGVSASVVIVVAGQILVSAILDHYGLLGADIRRLDLSRILGLAVVFAGVWLTVRR